MINKDVDRVEQLILDLARISPIYYFDILEAFDSEDYRTIMLAFGQIRVKKLFGRDSQGRYIISYNKRKEIIL